MSSDMINEGSPAPADEPLPPDTVNGPTEADEEEILRELYGEPDEQGVYRGARYAPGFTVSDVLAPVGVEDMLAQARKSLGLGEPNHIQRWYQGRNGNAFSGNFAWCEASMTYWAAQSGNYASNCPRGDRAYTVYGAQDGQYLGKWYAGTAENIRQHCSPGAKVYYDWAGSNSVGAVDHVGVCEKNLGDGRLQTIEGNTSDVCARRVRGSADIAGFWNPAYVAAPKPDPEPTPPAPTPTPQPASTWTDKLVKNLPTLDRGDDGAPVKRVQHLLLAAGQKLPSYGPDGDFGTETQSAVKAFQKSAKLTQDGVVGQHTYEKLLGA